MIIIEEKTIRNIKMTMQYDGTGYNGWQIQGNTSNTIQGRLTELLSAVCGDSIELIGSGRTDKGVHAFNQIANFKTKSDISVELLKESLNQKLRNDISIKSIAEAAPRFHARYNAIGKKYLYRVWNQPYVNVFERKYSCHVNERLNIDAMRTAAVLFVGAHDFLGFSSLGKSNKSTVRIIYGIDVLEKNGIVEIMCHGNSFLYNMVRIIAGTLIEIGLGQMDIKAVKEVLQHKERAKAGFTAPPHGLFLSEVFY
ncbi:MAG: tRNA pseudouridine(38-40) synthase TruA [Defluviitaleaceae bacterium]|nr:tRNA pseudouridine(38-40) synthase TruA [Defluviitaleaceae bacterium]